MDIGERVWINVVDDVIEGEILVVYNEAKDVLVREITGDGSSGRSVHDQKRVFATELEAVEAALLEAENNKSIRTELARDQDRLIGTFKERLE